MSFISREEAAEMISKYEEMRPSLLKNEYPVEVLPLTLTIPKDEVLQLLSQEGAAFLKIHFAMSADSNAIDTVMFAADEENNNIVPENDYLIIDKSVRTY